MKQREWDIRLACQKLQELEIETQQVLAIERNNQIQGSFASFPTPQLLKVRSFRSAQFVQLFIKFVPFRQTNSDSKAVSAYFIVAFTKRCQQTVYEHTVSWYVTDSLFNASYSQMFENHDFPAVAVVQYCVT